MRIVSLLDQVFSLTRRQKVTILMALDTVALMAAFTSTLLLRFDSFHVAELLRLWWAWVVLSLLLKLGVFRLWGVYSFVWRYASVRELMTLVFASAMGSLSLLFLYVFSHEVVFPLRLLIVDAIFSFIYVGISRILIRLYRDHLLYKKGDRSETTVLIVGAGEAGVMVNTELGRSKSIRYRVLGFIDDDRNKIGQQVAGVRVLGGINALGALAKQYTPQEIIIAIPSATGKEVRRVVEQCQVAKLTYRITPSLQEVLSGNVRIDQLRKVEIEDLLGREAISIDLKSISGYLSHKCVLITGAGGSIGSEIARQILSLSPRKIILLGHGENSIYDVDREIRQLNPSAKVVTVIADISSMSRLRQIFYTLRPEVVFHAAAHKHVPLMEDNVSEAIRNNVFGSRNLMELSEETGVEKFVMISTDKAVNPTNVMGATKRMTEMILQSHAQKQGKTAFMAVRFGNVLGSRGSVVPLFRKQIRAGGPVTITHPEVTRYFMTIPEAVQLVIQAGAYGGGGEIFVLDMGEPVKIIDLAREMIRLSGLEPDTDIDIKVVGLRPGEKLFEELLLSGEGLIETPHRRIFGANLQGIDCVWLQENLDWFETHIYGLHDDTELRKRIFELIQHPRYVGQVQPDER